MGCFFHLKQAWSKHLIKKLGFLAEQIKLAMSVGYLDLLCILSQNEIEGFGIPYVRSLIEHGLSKIDVKKWDPFWDYFERQWLPIRDSWNLCNENESYKSIMNRRNNGLERYNRRFNDLFSGGKPSLMEFVEIVEKESRHQADRLNCIRNGHEDSPIYSDVTIPNIPKAYRTFKKSFKKNATRKKA